jgi:hypothetical protein
VLGTAPSAGAPSAALCARARGVNVHASAAVPARDRKHLEPTLPSVDAVLASESCSMRVPITVEITTADFDRFIDIDSSRVTGSVVSSGGANTIRATFDVTGCHVLDKSGP